MLKHKLSLSWDPELIQRYNLNGPRYTSYPTAPQFSEAFTLRHWQEAVTRSNEKGNPLSLYFHIPFCDTVCYYCGCNKIITADKKRAIPYLEYLEKEIALQAQQVDTSRPVKQLHWGGGTPTYLNHEQMSQLMAATRKHFQLDEDGEFSIEIHPLGLKPDTIVHLKNLGFNRLSMGVQDFEPKVQEAVNRYNSAEEVRALVEAARDQGFESISLDLIYGLPYQNRDTLKRTLEQVIALDPDRLSLFNYAHMPHLFKVQKQIDESTLPEPAEKLVMLEMAINMLSDAGYVYIGMDHFAKPEDELARAQANGELQRNFQGYATYGNCDMLAFGISSIAMIDNFYVQNVKDLESYYRALDDNQLPLSKAFTMSRDDQLRRSVINQLICHFELDFKAVERQWQIDFHHYFAEALEQLKPMAEDGLVTLDDNSIVVNASGRLLIRRVCMAFDAYLKPQQSAEGPIIARSSRII